MLLQDKSEGEGDQGKPGCQQMKCHLRKEAPDVPSDKETNNETSQYCRHKNKATKFFSKSNNDPFNPCFRIVRALCDCSGGPCCVWETNVESMILLSEAQAEQRGGNAKSTTPLDVQPDGPRHQ
jgi:hypothetical protein